MKKFLALILMTSLMTVSCSKSGGGSSSEESTQAATGTDGNDSSSDNSTTTPAPTPTPPGNVPALALSFKTNVSYLSGFTTSDEEKYNEAVAIVKKVVATEAFRTKVLNHTYGGTKTYVQNNGLTNAEIYQDILDAAESLKPTKNNTMDVGVKLYYENSSVVGYTNGSITYINVNTKFFDSYDPNEVAGNLFHEWLHKLGYGHDSSATARRPYSVPYAIGYMIRDIGKNFL
jgi:hypothetical protein